MSDEVPSRQHKLPESLFKIKDYALSEFVITPAAEVSYEALFEPVFWVHVAKNLQMDAIVHVLPQKRDYYARLIVEERGPLFAKVRQIEYVSRVDAVPALSAPAPSSATEFEVAWKGPIRLYAVVRTADNNVMQDKFQTKAAALGWLAENAKGMAA
jgi:hypothetical protein